MLGSNYTTTPNRSSGSGHYFRLWYVKLRFVLYVSLAQSYLKDVLKDQITQQKTNINTIYYLPLSSPIFHRNRSMMILASSLKAGRGVFFLFASAILVFFHCFKNLPFPVPQVDEKLPNKGSFVFIPQHANETYLIRVEKAIVLDDTNNDEVSPLASCNPTAQVRIAFTEPKWTLTTFDKDGRIKHMGGDEFYIVYYKNVDNVTAVSKDPPEPTAIAFCHDHGNGTYTLDFSTTPMNPNAIVPQEEDPSTSTTKETAGILAVYFDYTCNIGRVAQPLKRLWKNRGDTRTVHVTRLEQQPSIRIFQLPPKPAAIQNLSSFSFVNFLGASTMRNVYRNRTHHYENNTYYYEIKMVLSTTAVNQFIDRLSMMRKDGYVGASDTAIVMGSDIWDVLHGEHQGPGFEDHLQACTLLVETARRLYPNATLLWK